MAEIVGRVRRGGDRALLAFAKKFDGLDGAIEVSRAEMRAAARQVPPPVKRAIRLAAGNIRTVARKQVPRSWSVSPVAGLRITQRVTPLDRVGCYVPGGRYPLPSSLLMTSIPAITAGVREVFAVCPRPDPTVMFAALEAGITRLFRVGGAHAVAALAYGTGSIPRVDKIVGPGNAYVAAAKALVAADCAIDFFAGPSEIAVVSSNGVAEWIAADLIAQAEHDPDARAILFTPSSRLARDVEAEIVRQLPATGPAAAALKNNGGIVRLAQPGRVDRALPAAGAGACRLRQRRRRRAPDAGRHRIRRRAERPGVRRLRHRVESRAADQRSRVGARRPERRGLRAGVVDSAHRPPRPRSHRPCRRGARRSRRPDGPCRVGPRAVGVRHGSDTGQTGSDTERQTGVRAGSDQGQTRVRPGSDPKRRSR